MTMIDNPQLHESGTRTDVAEYLRRPYSRILIPQDDGRFSAEILEFPGCFAQGDSAESAYASLEDAAASWLLACLEGSIPIPPPLTNYEVSGKFALRLPRSLYMKATLAAAKDGTSLNQWVTMAVSEKIGQTAVTDRIEILLAKMPEVALESRNRRVVVELFGGRLRTPQTIELSGDSYLTAENPDRTVDFALPVGGQSSRDHA